MPSTNPEQASAKVINVTTAGNHKIAKRQLLAVIKLTARHSTPRSR
jgi:hypothetical protein